MVKCCSLGFNLLLSRRRGLCQEAPTNSNSCENTFIAALMLGNHSNHVGGTLDLINWTDCVWELSDSGWTPTLRQKN